MLIIGLVIVLAALWLRAEKKLTVDLAAIWGILGTLFILIGAVSPFSGRIRSIFEKLDTERIILGIFVLAGGFFLSVKFSELKMKNQELAIRVSLLLQENERILSERDEGAQEDSVCCQHNGACRSRDGAVGASEAD